METYFKTIIKGLSHKKKAVAIVLIVLFVVVLIQLLYAPSKTSDRWKGNDPSFTFSSQQDSLIRKLAYFRAIDATSTYDSICLILSIPDSSVHISINGVNFYSAKIQSYTMDKFFYNINSTVILNQFQKPLITKELYSTIIKEPIKVKIAPKNEEEAAKMATLPDTLAFDHAKINYITDNGIKLTLQGAVKQSMIKNITDELKSKWSDFSNNTIEIFLATFKLKIYNYQPQMEITMDNIALTSIYRALPKQPMIVIYY